MKLLTWTIVLFFFALQNSSSQTINSIISGNWSDSSIWNCTCIPDSSDSVIIATGHSIVLTSDISIHHLLIDASASLSSDDHSITIAGDWINNGTFNEGTGMVVFNGNINAQSIQGANTFYSITINNSNGVNIITGSNQQVRGTLSVNAGTLTIPVGDSLILVSDSLGTARIGESTGFNITGNITMQRFIDTSASGWFLMAVPVWNATLEQWSDDFPTFTWGFPPYMPMVSSYDETVFGNMGYGSIFLDTLDPIIIGRGHHCWINPSNLTIDVTGPPVQGNYQPSVSYTQNAGPAHDGWNLVGNPYASTIDWGDPAWIKSNLGPAFQSLHPKGYYYVYPTGGPGINGASRYIPSSKGFWIHANDVNPMLQFNQGIKDTADVPFFPSDAPQSIYDYIILTMAGNGVSDQTAIRIVPASADGLDNLDVYKLGNLNDIPSISSQASSFDLAINSISGLSQPLDLPIRVTWYNPNSWSTHSYTIDADISSNFPNAVCIILEDLTTGTLTNLRDTSYTFTIAMDTALPPRFVLQLIPPLKPELISTDVDCFGDSSGSVSVIVSGIGPWNYTWTNAIGDTIQSDSNTSDTINTIAGLGIGTYFIFTEHASGLCGALDTVVIDQPSLLLANIDSAKDVSCNAGNNGYLGVASGGGTLGYTYQWDDQASQTDSFASGLPAGTYSVTVTDLLGCTSVDSSLILEPSLMSISTGSTSDTLGMGIGTTFAIVSGGTSPYSYQWSDSELQNTDTAINLLPGIYTVNVVDANGCMNNATAVVSNFTVPTSIIDQDKNPWFEIYPNPTEGSFTVEFVTMDDWEIKIYGLKGDLLKHVLLNNGDTKLIVDTKGWNKGIYICESSVEGKKQESRRVVVE